jgi:hypothetical protein
MREFRCWEVLLNPCWVDGRARSEADADGDGAFPVRLTGVAVAIDAGVLDAQLDQLRHPCTSRHSQGAIGVRV